MTVTSLADVKAKREKEWQAEVKRRRKFRWRLLRTSKWHIAFYTYHCDRCIFPISPGEEYYREMWVNKGWKRFVTKRFHYPQCYGPSEEEDREMREQLEKDRERERAEDAAAQKQAA